jgi:hypothetical protein
MRYFIFSEELRMLWYRSTNWLAGLDLNILIKQFNWILGHSVYDDTFIC